MSKKPKRSHRPRYGEGSFKYWPAKQLWRGCIDLGTDANGKRVRVWVSSRDEDEAWRRFQEARAKLAAEGPAAILPDRTTLGEWIEEWMSNRQSHIRPTTYNTDINTLRRWVIPTIGKVRLADASARELRALETVMREAGKSPTTIRYAQRLTQQACREARAEGRRIDETILTARKVSQAVSTRGAMTAEQALAVLAVASKRPDASRWVAALLQGMRQGECLGLTWDRVDLDAGELDISWQLQVFVYEDRAAGTFKIPDGLPARQLEGGFHLCPPKTAKGRRVIPLVPWMKSALEQWRAVAPYSPHGLVWPREDGRPQTDRADRDAWQDIQAQAGVAKPNGKPFLLHEARHTSATLLLEAGVDPEVIKAILGHSDIVTTRGYQHASQRLTRAALERVAQTLKLDA